MRRATPLRLVATAGPRPVAGRPHDPARRGYSVTYRQGRQNDCPGCGRSQWWIGRMMAECAFCGTALPLADTVDVVKAGGGSA